MIHGFSGEIIRKIMTVVEKWPLQRSDRCREVTVVEKWPLQRSGRCREVAVTWKLDRMLSTEIGQIFQMTQNRGKYNFGE